MKTYLMLFLLPLAACASLDIDGARVGVGLMHQRATNTIDAGELGKFKEHASGGGALARIELTNRVDDNVQVGLEIGGAEISLGDVTLDTLDVGGVFRGYLGDKDDVLRPYGGARLGYRAGWADVPGMGTGDRVDMLFGGLFVGGELRLSPAVSLFAEGGYEASLADGFGEHGLAGMAGMSFRF